ncbi:glycosyltransferase [Qingshengfaniella alkalisoli]|uniref:Glycosyltransferase n=1 Tax=Qingshengfaniella alkalisoli TaxID=2599296 RepID=A0A5B8I9A4_9RHOB|nr:glycosyltransferase [Qingshengfaniella alkalisoli]QDY70409.1 glycosyltransferase [Qingshengfaniella alkalisoli]
MDKNNQTAFFRFAEFLSMQGAANAAPDRDIREYVLSKRQEEVGFGYVSDTLENGFGANLPSLFPRNRSFDQKGFGECDWFLLSGTVYREATNSHRGAVEALQIMPEDREILFFESSFLATSHSWSHSFREGDPKYACLGYVYDDISHYFMADHPNRLIRKLNGEDEPTERERARADQAMQRIVSQRISKYNAQPMTPPVPASDYARRVLVCDQAYADASTVYGKMGDADFEKMLYAAIRENPDAEIWVKSHPDTAWEKGKRAGYYSHLESFGRVRILRDPVNPYSVFDLVDTVYVGTSQMGFEALMAGKKVVTFGAPFYGGWGLTDDRQEIPHRHRQRDLASIFHYFYVWYSIYMVPGKPAPSQIEDVLDYIETHRPYALPPTEDELAAPPRVSVILPVYGVEKYIEECIASIQRQTLREIEIIPVNDASPDGSQEIIDRLAAEDPRIRPILLATNAGQGFARNRGLEAARGEYIWFIDSDDWLVDPEFLENVVRAADKNDADMTRAKKAGEAIFDENDQLIRIEEDRTEKNFNEYVASTTFVDDLTILHSRHFCLWLYRRDFLLREGVKFITSQWEERGFLLNALLKSGTITLTNELSFMYRIRQSSTARREKNIGDVENFLKNFESIVQLLADHGADTRQGALRQHLAFQVSQFTHFLFFGFWYKTLCDKVPDRVPYLDRLSRALDTVDFQLSELTDAPGQVQKAKFGTGVYKLIIAALRARRYDWVDIAAGGKRVPQGKLYTELLEEPQDDIAREFQSALNTYARNTHVAPARVAKAPASKPRIILHLGATKTGSTALQHLMEDNRPALLRQGIWYPEVGLFWQQSRPHKQAGHADFARAAVRDEADLHNYIETGLALLGKQIHTIVLSSEAFFLNPHSEKLARYFSDYPCEMVVYLRRQDNWANSQYAEFVAGGAVGRVNAPFEDWLQEPKTRDWLDYDDLLSRWETVLDRDRIHVRRYGKSEDKDWDILTDFADTVNLPQLHALPRPQGAKANSARLSTAHVEMIRQFNTMPFHSRDAYFSFIEEVTQALQGWRRKRELAMPGPWFVTPELSERIMDAGEAGNQRIARDYFDGAPLFGATPRNEAESVLHAEELAVAGAAYARHTPPRPAAPPPPKRKAAPPPPKRKAAPRIVDYGVLGWRLHVLAPIIGWYYAGRGWKKARARLLTEPAEYARKNWAGRHAGLAGFLYPQPTRTEPRKPRRRQRLLEPLAYARGGQAAVSRLRADPVLFMRTLDRPASRAIGRVLFPVGELRNVDSTTKSR